jgi:polyphosphate kinase
MPKTESENALKSQALAKALRLDDAAIAPHFDKLSRRFFNRELSWLAFNSRVLQEAQNPHVPLLERVRFLSISAGNLDEFTMVRIAGLKHQLTRQNHPPSNDGLTTQQQLDLIDNHVQTLMTQQQSTWITLRDELKAQDINITSIKALNKKELVWLERYFEENIFPILTPIAVDPAHPFPFIPNLGMALVFVLKVAGKRKKFHTGMVPFPLKLPRFVTIQPDKSDPANNRAVKLLLIEEVIAHYIALLFPGFETSNHGLFSIVRDSDLEIEDEADDLIRHMDSAVKKRRHGKIVRLKTICGVSNPLKQFMLEHLPAHAHDVVEVQGMVGLVQLSALCGIARPDLKFPSYKVRYPERVNDYSGDCFSAISAKDFVIHHPFESFDVVVQLLEQAADDPNVVSIKQTLYRTSHDSPIVRALVHAAEQGKAVTALVELKARFDEEANIRLARVMEQAGISVLYGFFNLKTHAKISLITRQESGRLKSYAHFGTGNYHPQTAKVYTDLSFFTCDRDLCREAGYVFNYVTGYGKPKGLQKLVLAPLKLRKTLLQHIADEIAHAKAGRPANIWAKMNSLVDPQMIDALYVASQAGVQIDLIVRGICTLKPGIKGFSENIRVKSIVGRFLEHARIFAFGCGHALPSSKAKLYIASADWMTRNFDFRVEVMIPIETPSVHAQILDQIMIANLKDERQSWVLDAQGAYTRITCAPDAFAAHDYFMHNPSLSGRGKALQQLASPGTKIMVDTRNIEASPARHHKADAKSSKPRKPHKPRKKV